ncbi:MAG: hypothetical protein SGPRY_012337 [Prymnesium sp.]
MRRTHPPTVGPTKFRSLDQAISELRVVVRVDSGCRVEPEEEILTLDDGIASTHHRVLVPGGCSARVFGCHIVIRRVDKDPTDATLFDSSSHKIGHLVPDNTTDDQRPGREVQLPTELLIFACSPTSARVDSPNIAQLPNCGFEAVEVAMATQWASRVRISYGGEAESLRQQLEAYRPRRFLFSGHANVPWEGNEQRAMMEREAKKGKKEKQLTLGLTKPGGKLEVVAPAEISELLGAHSARRGGGLDLVFLNGCDFGALGRALLEAGIATVVCWETEVMDFTARIFANVFFQKLAEQQSPIQSFEAAKHAILRCTRLPNGKVASRPVYELSDRRLATERNGRQIGPDGKIPVGIPLLLQA